MQVNEESHEKIITLLKSNLFNLNELEKRFNIPQSTLSHAISGRRKIPQKYFDVLIKELKL
jgi:predicted transcriptional regulator